MKRILLCCLVICMSIMALMPAVSAQTEQLPSGISDTELASTLDAFLEGKKGNHAAVAVEVFRGDQTLYTNLFGYVDEAQTVALTEDSVLEWGSASKLLVWVSAMQLVQDAKLDLIGDIRQYLPENFLGNLRYDEPITMLNLMNHNAGFEETDFVLEVLNKEDLMSLDAYLAKYQPRQKFRPGEVVAYSNWGAALAGLVVEKVSGMPFSAYVQERIFAPLGMTHSAVAADLSDNPWVAEKRNDFVSYDPMGELVSEPTKVYILPYPAGMCVSTLSDFTVFAKALLNRDARLLSQEGFDRLYTPSLCYTGTDKARLYHGFLVDYDFAVPIVGHDGNTAGGSSRLLLDLENGIGMVVLTNQLGGSVYRTKMAELVFGSSDLHIEIDGHYMPARSVFSGPSKLFNQLFAYNACHITTPLVDGMYINILDDRFELSTCDYLLMDGSFLLMDALTVVWAVGALMCLAELLIRLLRLKKCKCNAKWATMGYCLLLSFPLILFAGPISPWIMLGYGVLLAAFTVCYLLQVVKRWKELGTLSRILVCEKLLIFAVCVVNLLAWDLIAVWL